MSSDCFTTITRSIIDFFSITIPGCTDSLIHSVFPCLQPLEHISTIESIRPLVENDGDIPTVLQGKCFHLIRTTSGREFRLLFDDIPFTEFQRKFPEGQLVKIIHRYDNSVINIYPMRRVSPDVPTQSTTAQSENSMIQSWYNHQVQHV